ncbi:unnamed protein product, partial [Ilex paraguariensis]
LGALSLAKEARDVSIGEVSKLRSITNGGLTACTVSRIVGDLVWKESSNLDGDEEEGIGDSEWTRVELRGVMILWEVDALKGIRYHVHAEWMGEN